MRQISREDFLKETINFYTSDNRSYSKDLGCLYLSPSRHKCAIGRYMTEQNAKDADTNRFTVFDVIDNKWLPEKILNLGEDFLGRIQDLHDENSYWNLYGLTQMGKIFSNNIIEEFNLDMEKYDI